jgi:hypothetical protein
MKGDEERTGDINPGKEATEEVSNTGQEYMGYYIEVDGKEVKVKVNGKTVNTYTEPKERTGTHSLDRGTIALQAMDGPVHFRDLMIRVWPN